MNIEWIQNARAGGAVTRLHTMPTIRQHNNAEHTFNAIIIAIELCQANPGVNYHRVLEYLLVHDLPESHTGDIPANAKVASPNLAAHLGIIEEAWIQETVPEVLRDWFVVDGLEYRVAKAADWLELAWFCVEEWEMGNRRIRVVYDNIMLYLRQTQLIDLDGVADIVAKLESRHE